MLNQTEDLQLVLLISALRKAEAINNTLIIYVPFVLPKVVPTTRTMCFFQKVFLSQKRQWTSSPGDPIYM